MPGDWRAWLVHAWGDPEGEPDTGARGASGQAALDLADSIRRHGLALPAEVAVEAHRPLLFVYAQLAHAASPVLDALLPGRRAAQLAATMENPHALEAVLARLRAPSTAVPPASAGAADIPSGAAPGPASEAPTRR